MLGPLRNQEKFVRSFMNVYNYIHVRVHMYIYFYENIVMHVPVYEYIYKTNP